jgi:hypothetical protein
LQNSNGQTSSIFQILFIAQARWGWRQQQLLTFGYVQVFESGTWKLQWKNWLQKMLDFLLLFCAQASKRKLRTVFFYIRCESAFCAVQFVYTGWQYVRCCTICIYRVTVRSVLYNLYILGDSTFCVVQFVYTGWQYVLCSTICIYRLTVRSVLYHLYIPGNGTFCAVQFVCTGWQYVLCCTICIHRVTVRSMLYNLYIPGDSTFCAVQLTYGVVLFIKL